MIYNLSSWKKLKWNLFQNENQIISQAFAPLSSRAGIPTSLLLIAFVPLMMFSAPKVVTLSLADPQSLILMTPALVGIWLLYKSLSGESLRKNNGGIHPNDTLFVLDGVRQTLTKQKGTTEEHLASFSEITLTQEDQNTFKENSYSVILTYPKGKRDLVETSDEEVAKQLFQEIKTCLHIT